MTQLAHRVHPAADLVAGLQDFAPAHRLPARCSAALRPARPGTDRRRRLRLCAAASSEPSRAPATDYRTEMRGAARQACRTGSSCQGRHRGSVHGGRVQCARNSFRTAPEGDHEIMRDKSRMGAHGALRGPGLGLTASAAGLGLHVQVQRHFQVIANEADRGDYDVPLATFAFLPLPHHRCRVRAIVRRRTSRYCSGKRGAIGAGYGRPRR